MAGLDDNEQNKLKRATPEGEKLGTRPNANPKDTRIGKGKSYEKDRKRLIKVENYFRSALIHPAWRSWRLHAIQAFRYREGEQWTPIEIAELDKRGQPPTVNNQVSVTIERLVGQYVKFKTRIAFRGRNAAKDDPLAEAYTDIFRFISQNCNLEWEERDMAEDGFTSGFGVLETGISFGDDYQPEIIIKNVNCFEIFADPYSRRYDWNEDAKYVCRAKWLDIDEAKELWPDSSANLESFTMYNDLGLLGSVDGFQKSNYVDQLNRKVRVIEVWWKELEREEICLFKNGGVVDKQNMTLLSADGTKRQVTGKEVAALKREMEYQEIDRVKPIMNVTTFTGGVMLEHKDSNRTRFPWIPYYAHRMKTGEPYSLIWLAIPMQDAINKRESKALHLLNTNRALFQQNAIADKDEFATEMARPDGMMEVRNVEQIKLESNLQLAESQFKMHNQAKEDFKHITGINPDAMGEKSEVRSGVGIARKVAMTDLVVAPLFDNLRRTRVALARNVLELVQKYYTEPKVFTITSDLNQTKVVHFDQNQAISKENVYDVVVDEVPDIATLKQEQFQILSQTLPNILQFGPFWAKFFIQMSELRDRDELVKMIDQQSQPPPLAPKIAISAQLDNLTAPERAFFYDKMGSPELAKAIMQTNPPPTAVLKAQADAQGNPAEAQAKIQHEQVKQQGEQAKLQMEMQGEALKQRGKAAELQAAMIKQQQDVDLGEKKHNIQLAKHVADIQTQSILNDLKVKAAQADNKRPQP